MENRKIGVLGYGEVGKAIASFYPDPFIMDMGMPFPDGVQFDILHVCIPYKGDGAAFFSTVSDVLEKHAKGALVFIHSTVPVGTTYRVSLENDHQFIVHSPVRGVHPNLAEGIRTFTKFVGTENPGAGRIAAEHLESIGITPFVVSKSKTTELMKLLDTTYYGLAIAFHSYAEKLCKDLEVSFDVVMTEANRSYNLGYQELGKGNVVRPVLFPPENGKIGGHCVIPNAELLSEQFGYDPILAAIIRHK